MSTTAINWEDVKQVVLSELEQKTLRPTELLDVLSDRYPDVVIKEGVLRLLQENSIKMTADQQLQLDRNGA